MGKKIVEIDSCFECPHCQIFGKELHCGELDVTLRHPDCVIPDNCPLEDAPDEENRKD